MKQRSVGPGKGRGAGEWIVAGGLLLLVGMVVVALVPEGVPGVSPPVAGGPGAVSAQLGTNALLTAPGQELLQMVPVAARTPAAEGGGGQSPVVQLAQAERVSFAGKVQQVSELPQSDGQLHVWLQGSGGVETRVSVGPGWFLTYLGCPLAHDIFVDGEGFTFERVGKSPLVYASRIRIDGKKCQLRNDEGFALWSNKFR
ncbi:MAG: hypothetical protein HQL57_00880 [Magnetococcales bacterium]|nr:hypothetical protein [Magnetococcales bacterium]MBF0155725.1 hypothetical protein [Magnetococcales bacterium]